MSPLATLAITGAAVVLSVGSLALQLVLRRAAARDRAYAVRIAREALRPASKPDPGCACEDCLQ